MHYFPASILHLPFLYTLVMEGLPFLPANKLSTPYCSCSFRKVWPCLGRTNQRNTIFLNKVDRPDGPLRMNGTHKIPKVENLHVIREELGKIEFINTNRLVVITGVMRISIAGC